MSKSLFVELDEEPVAGKQAQSLCSVLLPYPVERAYTYAVSEQMQLNPGDFVTVPVGNRDVSAVVWNSPVEEVAPAKLKSVLYRFESESLTPAHMAFIDWVARYNMAPKGFVLKMSMPDNAALSDPKPVQGFKKGIDIDAKTFRGLSPQRQRVLDVLGDGRAKRAADIARLAECSPAVVKGMVDKGLVIKTEIFSPAPCRKSDISYKPVALSDQQEMAARALCKNLDLEESKVSLLDGVTGAGKTEVYFEAVARAIEQDKQVLILLPEIALTNSFIKRFNSRFGCRPALWHSTVSKVRRAATWRGVIQGKTRVVIGARSALFLPFKNLGLIIVDEEHDGAFKQEDQVIYNARDMAVVRGQIEKAPVVLVSATPSLETITNAWSGKYEHIHLPDRHAGAVLPDIEIVDMRAHKPEKDHFISPYLVDAMKQTLDRQEQSLLFLNRRGYAPLTLCRACGHRMGCPRCSAWLVEHRAGGALQCHHCGYTIRKPKTCPECEEQGALVACGPGVERIYEEVGSLFPEARIITLASDFAGEQDTLRQALEDIQAHKYDIIIGTQIIAKGHHFPKLTLVGVVDADLGLQGGDLRAAEHTYQLLHQVAGRAGREDAPGYVYLQSWHPSHKVMQALIAHDRDMFFEIEQEERSMAHMPPFSRLAGIIVSGRDEKQVMDLANELGRIAPQTEQIQTLGPAEAPFYRLRGNFRRRLLVRANKDVNLQKAIAHWLSQVKIPSTLRVYIDIDPQSFF
jgi:primosomal protein N' (replication factor Y)